jgi:protein-disulfide isomerase
MHAHWTPLSILLAGIIIASAALIGAPSQRAAPEASGDELALAVTSLAESVDELAAAVAEAPGEPDPGQAAAPTPSPDSTAAAPGPTGPASLQDALTVYVQMLGLDGAAFSECTGRAATYDFIGDHVGRGAALGVSGTPTVIVNDKLVGGALPEPVFRALIEAELAGASWPEGYPDDIQSLASGGDPAIRVLDALPDVSGATIEGDPAADVMVVEFSNFACPFCKLFTDETLPSIRALADQGVAFAFMHFRIEALHPTAPYVHAAAVCAGEQGRFAAMHDLLFARQDEWADLPLN